MNKPFFYNEGAQFEYKDDCIRIVNAACSLLIYPETAVHVLNCRDFRKMISIISEMLLSDDEYMDVCHVLSNRLLTDDPKSKMTDRERNGKLMIMREIGIKRGLDYGSGRK